MHFEVSSKDCLNDEETKSFHFGLIEGGEEVVLFKVCQEVQACSCVVVLQHRTIIIQLSLHWQ